MDTETIRSLPKYHRRAFIGLLILICAGLISIDFLLLGASGATAHMISAYIESVVSAILGGLLIFWIFVSFTPYGESGGLDQIEPNRITKEFDVLLRDARRWRYKGNFGRYERGKVLPTIAGRPNAHATISVIDPLDNALCQRHAEYRNRINSIDKGKKYEANTVALEVVVTIIYCAWYVANKSVSIDLFLLSVFDPVRLDSNDEAMIITVEDRRSPALKLSKQHFMYEHFESQMQYAREQGRQVNLRGLPASPTIAALKSRDIETFLEGIGMEGLCRGLTSEAILNAVRESKNPYEN